MMKVAVNGNFPIYSRHWPIYAVLYFLSVLTIGLSMMIVPKVAHYGFDSNQALESALFPKPYWQHQPFNTRYWPRPNYGEKFLSWVPRPAQWNNQRLVFETMLVMAYLFNRTLIIPPDYLITKYTLVQKFDYYLDMESINEFVPVLSYADFAKSNGLDPTNFNLPKDMGTEVCWSYDLEPLVIFAYPKKPDPSNQLAWIPFRDFATLQRINHVSDQESIPQLVNDRLVVITQGIFSYFYTYFYIEDKLLDRYLKGAIKTFVHYRTEHWSLAHHFISYLPKEYYSIHWRRGDFAYPSVFDLKGETILENISDLFPKGATIYLATDEKKKEKLLSHLESRYRVRTWDDLILESGLTVDMSLAAVMEQLICAHAKIFVGSYYSTFTSYIHRLRGYIPEVADKNFYYTSIHYYPGDSSSLSSDDKPSWSKLGGGSLWSREYRDAFEGLDQ